MKDLATPALKAVMEEEIKFTRLNSGTSTGTGWKTSKTGASAANYGGATGFRPGMMIKGRFVVAETKKKLELFNAQYSIPNAQLKQDEDCLDTWFSSWLRPFECSRIFGSGQCRSKILLPDQYAGYRTRIIFFWVARMIMASYEIYG